MFDVELLSELDKLDRSPTKEIQVLFCSADSAVGAEQVRGEALGRQVGQHRRLGQSHYRSAPLHHDVLPRLRRHPLWRDSTRGLFCRVRAEAAE